MGKGKFTKWILKDYKGNVVIEGKKLDVINEMYFRFTYLWIFTDKLIKTDEVL